MNRIEKKKRYQIQSDEIKPAYNSALYLSNRQVSWLIASFIMLCFFIFIAGYFLGQRKNIDQILPHPIQSADLLQDAEFENAHAHNQQAPVIDGVLRNEISDEQWYKAQLIGFGTLRAAQQFVERLQQKNMPVRVQERHSKTAQGKEVIWYQVTTELFNDKQELIAFVERIKKEERLKDIRILAC